LMCDPPGRRLPTGKREQLCSANLESRIMSHHA
jgi:hypothetical protein